MAEASSNETLDCAVIGGGVAGALAALDLRDRGRRVAIFAAREGASALCAGTWDVEDPGIERDDERTPERAVPWCVRVLERIQSLCPGLLPAEITAGVLLRRVGTAASPALGRQEPPAGSTRWSARPMPLVVSELGLTRRAVAHDPAMLDLSGLPRGRVAVASLAGHPSFRGRQVARALDAEALARGEARRFAAVEIDFLRRGRDRVLHPHQLAAELDLAEDDPRRGLDARYVMSEAIRAGLGGLSFDAVLVPPILGLCSDDVRSALEAAVGIPIGEAIGLLPGVAGARLMRRLHRALEAHEVDRLPVRIDAVAPGSDGLALHWAGGRARARAVIVATGKRLGGGIATRVRAPGGLDRSLMETLLGVPIDRPGVEVDPQGRLEHLPEPLADRLVFGCGAVLAARSGIGGLLDVARSSLVASAGVDGALKRAG